MNGFNAEILSPVHCETLEGLENFGARDDSGSFGLWAGAERRIAVLVYGLALCGFTGGRTEYLALPGGLLYFAGNHLRIATADYWRGPDPAQVLKKLEEGMRRKEEIGETKRSLKRMDGEILKRLTQLRLGGNS